MKIISVTQGIRKKTMNRNKNCQVKMADGKLMKSKHDQIDRQSKRLLTTLTPVHWSQPRPLSWTFKSPIIATSPFNHYLLFILSLLLLLLSTTTTLTAGHEAKNGKFEVFFMLADILLGNTIFTNTCSHLKKA